MLNFIKSFSASVEMVTCFLFHLLMWYITLTDLWVLKNPCIYVINPIWYGDSVCWYFVEEFYVCVHQWYWPVIFFFFFYVSFVLVSEQWWPYRMSSGVFLLLQFFLFCFCLFVCFVGVIISEEQVLILI